MDNNNFNWGSVINQQEKEFLNTFIKESSFVDRAITNDELDLVLDILSVEKDVNEVKNTTLEKFIKLLIGTVKNLGMDDSWSQIMEWLLLKLKNPGVIINPALKFKFKFISPYVYMFSHRNINNTQIVIEGLNSVLKELIPHLQKRLKEIQEQENFYISLSERTKLDKSKTKTIVDKFIKLVIKKEQNINIQKKDEDIETLIDFSRYVKECMHYKEIQASGQTEKISDSSELGMTKPKKIISTQKYFSEMVQKFEYLIKTLENAKKTKKFTVREKIVIFFKNCGLLIVSLFGRKGKIKASLSPLETKKQANFDSAFNTLKTELEKTRIDINNERC